MKWFIIAVCLHGPCSNAVNMDHFGSPDIKSLGQCVTEAMKNYPDKDTYCCKTPADKNDATGAIKECQRLTP